MIMRIFGIIEKEISNYLSGAVPISEGYNFSQYNLVRRIMLYQNRIYPSGKVDSQKKYKYWFDIIEPRVQNERKNIDFDTKHIVVGSERKKDALAMFLINARLKQWLREKGEADELNDGIEQGSSWGNIVWKKLKDGKERVNFNNFYVINQTAKSLDDTPVIERHNMTQSDLRKKSGIWNNVDRVISECGNKTFKAVLQTSAELKETPYYEIFERNGEISEKDLFEAQNKSGGDENKYILAKIVLAGLQKGDKKDESLVLFADKIPKMPYYEYHRGPYKGRWFREGLTELLFDHQTRANEIGNQLARGLEWASKIVLRSKDRLIVNNIMTDMQSGDIIKADELTQVDLRLRNLDQLIAEWNRLMADADKISNSMEIISGEPTPSGMPFRLGALLNINANKLYDFIREKLGLSLEKMFQNWILPPLIKDMKQQTVMDLTGDEEMVKRFQEMLVQKWYARNLIALGPHSPEQAEFLKTRKLIELRKRPQAILKLEEGIFDDIKPRMRIIITGENINLRAEMESLATFISLEQDPVRRTALIEKAMRLKGVFIEDLPKSTPEQLAGGKITSEGLKETLAPPEPTLAT